MANGWRGDRLSEIVRSMAARPRHEALRGLVTELLREGFGAAFSELEHERYLVDTSPGTMPAPRESVASEDTPSQ